MDTVRSEAAEEWKKWKRTEREMLTSQRQAEADGQRGKR